MYAGVLLSALCFAAHGWAQMTTPTSCATGVHVISARGHGGKLPPYGLSGTTVGNITEAISGSDAVALPYPSHAVAFYKATVKGGNNLKKYIKDYAASCPDTKIVLQGYSEGGVIVMNALCGGDIMGYSGLKPLSGHYAKYITAVVIYGDDTSVANQPYNLGNCTKNSPAPRKNFDCGRFTKKIASWRLSQDPKVCVGGTSNSSHYDYPQLYDHDVATYVVEKFDHSS